VIVEQRFTGNSRSSIHVNQSNHVSEIQAGKREFASVELKLLQKPLVAALARVDFQKLEVESRMVYGSFKERAVSVVRSQR
jgi:hypothetical protein